jgi:hypothetical protein
VPPSPPPLDEDELIPLLDEEDELTPLLDEAAPFSLSYSHPVARRLETPTNPMERRIDDRMIPSCERGMPDDMRVETG